VVRYDPLRFTQGASTFGRLCVGSTRWSINNAGWNSAEDYTSASESGRPLVALFGDSYIEAFQTDPEQHVDAVLQRMLPGTSAYAFGFSAWYLEQYVAVARYARQRFQPDVIVIFTDQGDVSDSIRENGVVSPFSWQIASLGGSFVQVPPTEVYVATIKSRLAKRSALVNYLRYNARLALPGMNNAAVAQPTIDLGSADGLQPATAGSGTQTPADARWRTLLPAARYMVQTVCQENPGTPIIFASHGERYLAPSEVASAPLSADARAVREACAGNNQCSFLDLRSSFSIDWAEHGVRFESADARHWNAYANRVVARTLADFITKNSLLYPEAVDSRYARPSGGGSRRRRSSGTVGLGRSRRVGLELAGSSR
jgi:hypothetical protein